MNTITLNIKEKESRAVVSRSLTSQHFQKYLKTVKRKSGAEIIIKVYLFSEIII